MEIDASGPSAPVRTYDVYVSSIRNSSSGIFDLFIQEPVSGTAVINVNGKDFHRSTFGFPPTPSIEYVGQLNFTDEDFVGGNPTNETINMRIGYQGFNPGIAAGNMDSPAGDSRCIPWRHSRWRPDTRRPGSAHPRTP